MQFLSKDEVLSIISNIGKTLCQIKNRLRELTPSDEKVGDLDRLTTSNKENVVSALNEVNSLKADRANTLAGYGIADAYTKAQSDSVVSAAVAGKADSSSLATVATTGSYSDLSNKPAIPDISGKANDSEVVHISGAETVDGTKTFRSNIVGNITGNAVTATRLETPRNINNVSFDGTSNITIQDENKVALDGSNALNIGTSLKEFMAHMSKPSSRRIDLSLADNPTTYTAPADGYVCCWAGIVGQQEGFLRIDNLSSSIGALTNCDVPGYAIILHVPCSKGDSVGIQGANIYNSGGVFVFSNGA